MYDIAHYQSTTAIIECIMMLSLLLFLIFLCVRASTQSINVRGFATSICIIAGLILVFTSYLSIEHNNILRQMRDDADYTIFLDGNEVERENIDITMYRASYDDVNKKIFLTNKRR